MDQIINLTQGGLKEERARGGRGRLRLLRKMGWCQLPGHVPGSRRLHGSEDDPATCLRPP